MRNRFVLSCVFRMKHWQVTISLLFDFRRGSSVTGLTPFIAIYPVLTDTRARFAACPILVQACMSCRSRALRCGSQIHNKRRQKRNPSDAKSGLCKKRKVFQLRTSRFLNRCSKNGTCLRSCRGRLLMISAWQASCRPSSKV